MIYKREQEITERFEAATPGKWCVRYHPADPEECHVSAPITPNHPYHSACSEMEILSDEQYPTKKGDIEFIANAKTDIDYLLGKVLELRTAVELILEGRSSQMITAEEWDRLAVLVPDESGKPMNWRTQDELDQLEEEGETK